jgi:dolichol-phosphate mannosyltransferase
MTKQIINKLSIIIPVYNEEKTVLTAINKVLSVNLGKIKKEIIVINDGSIDNTKRLLRKFKKDTNITIINFPKNRGKGYALRAGFKKATGDVITIQDGDLEYNPNDFKKMLKKISEDNVNVVYGSRRLNKKNIQYSGLSFYLGGLFLTWLANLLYGSGITDEPTCYKMFNSNLLKSIPLKSRRFEFCPEVTAKISRMDYKIHEVPISYRPRHKNQGKKIKFKDFFEAIWVLLKYRFIN